MNALQVSIAVLAAILVFGAYSGSALKCHVCNSGDNYEKEDCKDPEGDKFLVDCDEYGRQNEFPEYINATLCRKLVQTVEDETRVVRSCARDGRTDRCVERTGTREVKVTYCECKGDGCNGASGVQVTFLALISSTLLAVFAARS